METLNPAQSINHAVLPTVAVFYSYWVAVFGRSFSIASPMFSAPRNWVTKGVFGLDCFNKA